MPFTPTQQPIGYLPSPPPVLEGSQRIYLDREFKQISEVLNAQSRAIREIQEYLQTLP